MTLSTETAPLSDARLVEEARRGDAGAFGSLIDRHFGLAHAIALARLGDREAAEDLAQEVFLRASLSLDQLRDPGRFPQWLAQITRNLSASWLRRAQRRSELAAMVSLDEQVDEIPDRDQRGGRELMEAEEQSRILWDTIQALPPDRRELILLHCAEGLSAAEIAARLGVHRTTISRQIRRALATVRRRLEPALVDTVPPLRAPRRAMARTVAVVAAAWTLRGTARAALAAAAASTAPSAKAGLLAKTRAAFAAGGKPMMACKAIAVILLLGALIGRGVDLLSQSGRQGQAAAQSEERVMLTITLPDNAPLELMPIPAGRFIMGSEGDTGWEWKSGSMGPAHEVSVPAFRLGRTEATQAQWLALMGGWPGAPPTAAFGLGDDHPAYGISWNDAQGFIAALNEHVTRTGQGPATFRLPSEAEWEYACRAGSTTRFHFGDSNLGPYEINNPGDLGDYDWFCGNMPDLDERDTKPVATLLPNAWGLFDMHGNVREFCQDVYKRNYEGAPTDGSAVEEQDATNREPLARVVRGGARIFVPRDCASANRVAMYPNRRREYHGFRVARDW